MHDVVVIGAGHNGLVCSYYLARKGLKVALIEAAETVGGAAVTDEFHPGFRNSAASYTVSLLQPKVIEDMDLHRHGLKIVLRKIDNLLPTRGPEHLLAGRDGLTRAELVRHHKGDGAAYDRYLEELQLVVGLIKKWLMRAPPGFGLADLPGQLRLGADLIGLKDREIRILHRYFTASAGDILDARFEGQLAKALFGFDGIVGNFASPYDFGTGYVLLHHLFGEVNGEEGAWGHAIGGMGAITQAMAKACREAGVDILLNTPATEVIVEGGRAVGVLAGGKAYRGRQIVAGINPKLLFDYLVPDGAVERQVERHFTNWACESATFRMNVALERLPNFTAKPGRGDHLTAGIIMAPSLDHMTKAHASAVLDGWSRDPVIEMLVPSTLDPTLAPKGKHVASLFCQHFRYRLPDGRKWEDER
ncbi:MAG: NAD(P)/FAD-dependent oxidoreductase, partial [Sphingomonadaceae bacterium]